MTDASLSANRSFSSVEFVSRVDKGLSLHPFFHWSNEDHDFGLDVSKDHWGTLINRKERPLFLFIRNYCQYPRCCLDSTVLMVGD